MNRKYTYITYFVRMLRAARKMTARRAAVLGIHFERWSSRQTGFGIIGLGGDY